MVIQLLIERKGFISGFAGKDAGRHALGFQRFPQPHVVISSVCQKDTVIGKKALENGRPLVITALSFGLQKQEKALMLFTYGMKFEIQPSFGPSYKARRIFLSRLVAVR